MPSEPITIAVEVSMRAIRFVEENHVAGDPGCNWCEEGFPIPCECGGLIHAQFSQDDEGQVTIDLTLSCDTCGYSPESEDVE